MKKIILLAGLLFTGLTQAQVIEATGNGTPITEGQTFTFNSLTEDEATLYLSLKNISTETINVKLRVNTITNNSNGQNVQFCFGELCFFNIDEGDTVPNGSGVTLAPNASNDPNNHFFNNFAGNDTSLPVEYNLSFIKVDDSGAFLETLLSFNYVYQSTMSVNDLASLGNIGITVNNTMVKDLLNVNAGQPATMEIYGLSGKLLKTVAVNEGSQAIDLSALSTAVYIAKFTNSNKQSSSVRIVKQ